MPRFLLPSPARLPTAGAITDHAAQRRATLPDLPSSADMLAVTALDLPRTAHLDLDQDDEAQRALQDGVLVVALGGHATVEFAPGTTGVWIPESDELDVRLADASFQVAERHFFVSDFARRCSISTATRGTALALIARTAMWAQMPGMQPFNREPGPPLFPGDFAVASPSHAELVQHVRALMQAAEPGERNRELRWITGMLREEQAHLDTLVNLCPGRTLARRRQVFLRLQRIRHAIASDPSTDTSLPRLASLANYSVSQFIAVFRRVFGETPHAYVLRCRVERAHNLMAGTALGIGEISFALGFQARSSFTRAFKMRTGHAPSTLRACAKLPD